MMKMRADLARLGNLLKYATDHEDFERTAYNKDYNVSDPMIELEDHRTALATLIKALNKQ